MTVSASRTGWSLLTADICQIVAFKHQPDIGGGSAIARFCEEPTWPMYQEETVCENSYHTTR